TPTRASNLAAAIWRIVEASKLRGVHHFTDGGTASRYDLAVFVYEILARNLALAEGASVQPVPGSTFPTPARRPLYSVLDKHATWAALSWTPEHWSGGVERTVVELLNA